METAKVMEQLTADFMLRGVGRLAMYTALASETLRHTLLESMTTDIGPSGLATVFTGATTVSLETPQAIRSAGRQGLSVWLYRVVRDESRLNDPPAVRTLPGGRVELIPPPLPLRLHYLLTPLATASPEVEHRILGRALQFFHAPPTLAGPLLQAELAGSDAEIHTHLEALGLEEIARVWEALEGGPTAGNPANDLSVPGLMKRWGCRRHRTRHRTGVAAPDGSGPSTRGSATGAEAFDPSGPASAPLATRWQCDLSRVLARTLSTQTAGDPMHGQRSGDPLRRELDRDLPAPSEPNLPPCEFALLPSRELAGPLDDATRLSLYAWRVRRCWPRYRGSKRGAIVSRIGIDGQARYAAHPDPAPNPS